MAQHCKSTILKAFFIKITKESNTYITWRKKIKRTPNYTDDRISRYIKTAIINSINVLHIFKREEENMITMNSEIGDIK